MAADEIIDSLVDRSKVKSDLDFVNDLLEKVLGNIEKINKVKLDLGSSKGMGDTAKAAEAAAKAANDTATATQKLATAEQALSNALGTVDQQWRNVAGQLKDNIKLQVQYESELKKVKDSIKEQNAAVRDTGSSFNTVSQKVVELKQRETELKVAIAEVNQTIKAQVKETHAAETSYDAMNQELGQMRNLWRQISAEERNSPFGQQLKKNIQGLDAELKRLDGEVGNHQRNVGNYKQAWNGLDNSIAQIARELPAFTYSLQTGFSAIANNVPIAADAIKKTAAEVKAMRAEGKEVPGVFRQIAGSLLSFNTFMSVGLLALTVYGKEIGNFFTSLFTGKKTINEAAESQRILNDALGEGGNAYKEAVTSVNELKINIDLAKKGLLDKTDVVKQYNEGIGKTIGEVKTLDEVETALTKKGDAYIQMMLLKAAANLALQDAAKKALEAEQLRRKNEEEFLTTGDRFLGNASRNAYSFGGVGAANSAAAAAADKMTAQNAKNRKDQAEKQVKQELATFEDIAKKFQEDAAKIASENQFDFFGGDSKSGKSKKEKQDKVFEEGDAIRKANYEIQKQTLEDQKRLNDEIVKNDEAAFLQRTEAAKKYIAATQALNKLEYDYKLADINAKEQNDLASAQRDYKNIAEREKAITYIKEAAKAERLLAEQQFNSKVQQSDDAYRNDYLKKLAEFLKKDEEARLKHEAEIQKNDEAELKVDYDKQLADLEQSFADRLISEKDYNRQRLRLKLQYDAEVLKIQIAAAEKELEIQQALAEANGDEKAFERVRAARIKIADLQIKLSDLVAKYQIKKNEEATKEEEKQLKKREANLEKLSQKIRNIGSGFVDALQGVGDLLGAKSEVEINRLQGEIDLINEKREAEIEAANATITNEQEKAAKIATINATADARQRVLEQRQRQERMRQARYEKAVTIAQIIVDTAAAVVKALKVGIPYAIAVGAVGAAKLAAAIATPVPAYAEGTDDHPGGFAYVGDGGKKELVVTPSGKSYITPDKTTLVNLPKGTKVFPDAAEVLEGAKYAAFKTMPATITSEQDYTQHMISSLNGRIDKLTEVVKNKREWHINNTRAGMQARWQSGYNTMDWLSENFH